MVAVASNLIDAVVTQLNEYTKTLAALENELKTQSNSRNRHLEEMADTVAESQANLASSVSDAVKDLHGRDRVAVVALLRRVLREFDPEVKALLDQEVPKEASQTDTAQAAKLREDYNNVVEAYLPARQLLQMSGSDQIANFPEVKKLRGGAGGTRGARLAGKWTVTVDGKQIDKSQFSSVGVAADTNAGDVRVALQKAIPAAAEDSWFKDVAPTLDTFSFVVNGKTVVYTKVESTNGSAVEDSDENDEEMFSGSDDDEPFGGDDDEI